jgi:hypothetical protein
METLGNKNQQKSATKFYCELCHYSTSRKCNFDDHNLSAKHKKTLEGNDLETFFSKNQQKSAIYNFSCENCNKDFKTRSGLWKHNKICICENNKIENTVDKKDELIDYLMKENKEIKELILELAKKDSYNNCNNTVNSHNKAFNLNFFLNETCKDAMNITDFVESLKLQLSDLENVGEIGYVNGISNIIVKNLNLLEENKRPIHCADKKREVLYIKDEDKWEKDEEKKKIRKIIKKVACKNQRLLPEFKKEHPDCGKYHSKYSDQYNKLVIESMGGSGDNDLEKEDKIIRNIAKEVTIDKNIY